MLRRNFRIALVGLAWLLPLMFLTVPSASAHNGPYTYAGCTVTMRQPQTSFTTRYGGTWADARALVSTSGCTRGKSIWVCLDYRHRRNDGVWTAWRNSSPADTWKFARNACSSNAGNTGSKDAFSSWSFAHMSYEYGFYAAKCTDLKGVELRVSSWVQTNSGRSSVYRGDLLTRMYC